MLPTLSTHQREREAIKKDHLKNQKLSFSSPLPILSHAAYPSWSIKPKGMDANINLSFLPGDCFTLRHAEGFRVGQVIRVCRDGTLVVKLWSCDTNVTESSWSYYLPIVLRESGEEATIPRPTSLAALVFICNANDIYIKLFFPICLRDEENFLYTKPNSSRSCTIIAISEPDHR
jgi:hypothetical protein